MFGSASPSCFITGLMIPSMTDWQGSHTGTIEPLTLWGRSLTIGPPALHMLADKLLAGNPHIRVQVMQVLLAHATWLLLYPASSPLSLLCSQYEEKDYISWFSKYQHARHARLQKVRDKLWSWKDSRPVKLELSHWCENITMVPQHKWLLLKPSH
jgi:hypothetical protein